LDLFYRQNLAIHELGHLYQFHEGTRGHRRRIQEVFATWDIIAYQSKFQPETATATLDYVSIGSAVHFPKIKQHSLAGFEAHFISMT